MSYHLGKFRDLGWWGEGVWLGTDHKIRTDPYPNLIPALANLCWLTHWGRVTHICISKIAIVGSDNGLAPARRHYLNQCWNIVNWTLGNKFQWNLNRNLYTFIQENVFENVWKMAAILSWPQCVKGNTGDAIDISHKSHNVPVPYPTIQHSEQKCAHCCSERCIVGYGTGALWDLWDCSIMY